MKLLPIVTTVALLAIACGETPPAATPPSAPAPGLPASPGGGGSPEGGECSDDVAVQKKCAAGLVCGPPKAGAPISEHTPGVCKKP
jgi:hypothetical protein